MIEKKAVFCIRCDECGKIIASFDSEEEARQRITPEGYQGDNYLFKAYVCAFCGRVICGDCQIDVAVKALHIPVCKKCATKHTIAELEKLEGTYPSFIFGGKNG